MQHSLNKDLQQIKWQPPRPWISSPDCMVAQDKQLRQYLLIPKQNGRCSQIVQTSQIRMSRHLDSSTTTHMAWTMVHPVVPLDRNIHGHPLAGLLWERQFEKILFEIRLGKNFQLRMPIRTPWKRVIPMCMWMPSNWLERNTDPMWKLLNKEVDLGEPTSFLDHVYLGCTQRQCQNKKRYCAQLRATFESRISAGGTEKLPYSENFRISSWSSDMEGRAKECVERYCESANKSTQQLYKVSTPCIDDHHLKENWNL